jgi:hypothetical protein
VVGATCAAELTEVGVRVDLSMRPLRESGAVLWDAALGAYATFSLNESWEARILAGFDVGQTGPFFGASLLRAIAPYALLEGNALLQWGRRTGFLTVVTAGGRVLPDVGPSHRLSIGILPLAWTLTGTHNPVGTAFTLGPSLTVDAGTLLNSATLFGEAITLHLHPLPAGPARPVWPIGGFALSLRLTTHVGYVPGES